MTNRLYEFTQDIGDIPIIFGVSLECLEDKSPQELRKNVGRAKLEKLAMVNLLSLRMSITRSSYPFSTLLHMIKSSPKKKLYFLEAHGTNLDDDDWSVFVEDDIPLSIYDFVEGRTAEYIGAYFFHVCNPQGHILDSECISRPVLYPTKEAGLKHDSSDSYRLALPQKQVTPYVPPSERIKLVHDFQDGLSELERSLVSGLKVDSTIFAMFKDGNIRNKIKAEEIILEAARAECNQ